MNSSYSDVEAELKLLCATSEIRAIPDEPGKAAYVLKNYCGDLEISQTSLSHFFDISSAELKGRLGSILMGYTNHGYSKPKYLAPILQSGDAPSLRAHLFQMMVNFLLEVVSLHEIMNPIKAWLVYLWKGKFRMVLMNGILGNSNNLLFQIVCLKYKTRIRLSNFLD